MEATDRDQAYWGTERMSYEDELDAWRERTARPVRLAPSSADPGQPVFGGLFGQLPGLIGTTVAPSPLRSWFETSPDEVLAA